MGKRMPYANLFTRMRSPTSSVGIIEPDGIRNGSNRNERNTNTTRITGKKPAGNSIHAGWWTSRSRRPLAFVGDRLTVDRRGRAADVAQLGLRVEMTKRRLGIDDALATQHQPIDEPDGTRGDHQPEQDDREIQTHLSSTCRMARKASCGISTDPTCFMRFLPAFCFSSNLRLREMSPP